jgi:hypothetical protein
VLTVGPAISQGLQAAVTSEKVLLLTTNYVPMTAEDRWKDYVCQDFAEPGALFQRVIQKLVAARVLLNKADSSF